MEKIKLEFTLEELIAIHDDISCAENEGCRSSSDDVWVKFFDVIKENADEDVYIYNPRRDEKSQCSPQ